MTIPAEATWRNPLLFSREQRDGSNRSALLSLTRSGELTRIFPGTYVETEFWRALDRDARYRLRIQAVVDERGQIVVSHESAAALWRLPRFGPRPTRVHVLEAVDGPGRPTSKLVRHPVGIPDDGETIDGIRVTTLARTVVDVAATNTFVEGVTAMDAALRRTSHPFVGLPQTANTKDDLFDELERISLRHGRAKARRAIEFANALADRPGESISRVSMSIASLPAPQLQVRLQGASGRWYTVDFWWPQFNHIGEFDGRYKYSDPEFLRGRTPHQALLDEKAREDDLRAAGHGMSRWMWETAQSPKLLRGLLVAAGVR